MKTKKEIFSARAIYLVLVLVVIFCARTGNVQAQGPSFTGSFEVADCNSISGWAEDANNLNTAVRVNIFSGSTIVATALANGQRKDVGAIICCEDQFIESPAFAAPGGCRDTTGAGDAFHAGFIYGRLKDEDVESCMKIGTAVAALKCRSLGARHCRPCTNSYRSCQQSWSNSPCQPESI